MGSRLGRRVVQFANLPMKLLMPTTFTNIQEIAFKTIPSASKIEIKRLLESLYGFDVEKVRTLNMDGKKKKRGGLLIAKPDYKKAYVTLKTPLSIDPELYPIRVVERERESKEKQGKARVFAAAEAREDGKMVHWLDEKKEKGERFRYEKGERFKFDNGERRKNNRVADRAADGGGAAKFPWSSMRSGAGAGGTR
ncbi:hypothetical protein RIF29_08633 [Crotalaria pallida]|uniref:Large ribosomal subunit protein uL23m n=1 Tax=Crotalaria pallida TaxID=3830 RepID=A0AAN9IKE2_CROPI